MDEIQNLNFWYQKAILAVPYPHKEQHSWDSDSEETSTAQGDSAKNVNINFIEINNIVKKTHSKAAIYH